MGHKCICVSVELCRRSYIFTQNMHTKAVKNKIWLPQRKKHYNYLWIAKLAKFLSQICPCIIARTKFPIYIVRGESENWKYRRIKYPSSTARWHFLSEKNMFIYSLRSCVWWIFFCKLKRDKTLSVWAAIASDHLSLLN